MSNTKMQQGDFTTLAKHYINRPAYSDLILQTLLKLVNYDATNPDFQVVEVGAGTGKLTKMLLELGLNVIAIEPNDAMREEGIKYTEAFENIIWKKGSGEVTGVEDHQADWIIMASSFHWTDPNLSLPEFSRILKANGHFTAIWNPRNLEISELHTGIEKRIYEIAPNIKRKSSGSGRNSKKWEYILPSTGHFKEVIFTETDHEELFPKERYMGAWHSVNDIPAQAGPEKWQEILKAIEDEIKDLDIIPVPYKMRAWTTRKA